MLYRKGSQASRSEQVEFPQRKERANAVLHTDHNVSQIYFWQLAFNDRQLPSLFGRICRHELHAGKAVMLVAKHTCVHGFDLTGNVVMRLQLMRLRCCSIASVPAQSCKEHVYGFVLLSKLNDLQSIERCQHLQSCEFDSYKSNAQAFTKAKTLLMHHRLDIYQ